MIIRQYLEVAWDNKVQTRRIVKDGDRLSGSGFAVLRNEREYVAIGKTYPVIPKMYSAAVWIAPDGTIRTDAVYRKGGSINSDTSEWEQYRVDQRDTFRERGFTELRIRITGIRQERLQDITEEDAVKEGFRPVKTGDTKVEPLFPDGGGGFVKITPVLRYETSVLSNQVFDTARAGYEALWDSINTKKGTRFADNPLCWVLDFERVK